jgi:FkbM family methyltransferase
VFAVDGTEWISEPGTDDHLVLGDHEYHLAPIIWSQIRDLGPESVAVVVGAHVGTWAVRIARTVHTIAYEASEATALTLAQNARLNHVEGALEILVGAAWSESDLVLRLVNAGTAERRSGSLRATPDGPADSEVAVTRTIDSDLLHDTHRPSRVAFLMTDVEGAEAEVLRGAAGVLDRDHPVLLIELHEGHPGAPADLRQQVYDLLLDHGYRWSQIMDPRGFEEHLLCMFTR